MSVKIMGAVWDLDNSQISREEKYVLLAYTDHADHDGNNMYPSIETICIKTGYKERAAQMITKSLVKKGYLIASGKGRNGTNKWSYGGGAKNAGVQPDVEGGANRKGEGVQQDAPKPLTIIKPSSSKEKAEVHPNIKLFREVVSRYPAKVNYDDVISSIARLSERLGRDAVKDDLVPFYKRWCGLGYNPFSLSWMEWAETGTYSDKGYKPISDTGRSTSETLVREL